MATKELNAKEHGPSSERDVARYTEAEYARVALAADTAEHEAAGLAEINTRQAREIERLKKAIEATNRVLQHIDDRRQQWKQLRHDALDDINYWREEAAKRILMHAHVRAKADPDALRIIENALKAVHQARWFA